MVSFEEYKGGKIRMKIRRCELSTYKNTCVKDVDKFLPYKLNIGVYER